MFPDNDPEKEIYDNFRSKFPREDNSVLMIYAPPTNPLNMENLIIKATETKNMRYRTGNSLPTVKPCRAYFRNIKRLDSWEMLM